MDLETIFKAFVANSEMTFASIPKILGAFIEFSENAEGCRQKWQMEMQSRLQMIDELKSEKSKLEKQLQTARRLLDEEKAKTRRVVEDYSSLKNQFGMVRDLISSLQDKKNHLADETREKLSIFSIDDHRIGDEALDRLDTITELESTGSVMSDLSYTRDEEDFLNDSGEYGRKRRSAGRRRRSNSVPPAANPKKRRSSKAIETKDQLIATTTVTVPSSGPITATSVLETFPSVTPSTIKKKPLPSAPPLSDSEYEIDTVRTPNYGYNTRGYTLKTRPHNFQQKAMIKGEPCNVCMKRMKFSALGFKCRDCKTICHIPCKDKVPLPCVPVGNTPNYKAGQLGSIGDYTPLSGPMVPSLLVHSIKEIEARGLTEVGIYRIPGSDKDVKTLKEKFLKGKGVPNLSQVLDIHTVCGCVKDFLRSLREPLVTQLRWSDFTKAANLCDGEDRKARLYQIISELPQPNRDTLAFLILHLQRVAEMPDCKMPISNLAKVFAPNIVGMSTQEGTSALFADTSQAIRVMEELLHLPSEYWENFIKSSETKHEPELQKTPSTNSLGYYFFSTSARSRPRKIKYFDTP